MVELPSGYKDIESALQNRTLWTSSGNFLTYASPLICRLDSDEELDDAMTARFIDLASRSRKAKIASSIAFWICLFSVVFLAGTSLMNVDSVLGVLGLRVAGLALIWISGAQHFSWKKKQSAAENGLRALLYKLERDQDFDGAAKQDLARLNSQLTRRGREWLAAFIGAVRRGEGGDFVFGGDGNEHLSDADRIVALAALLDAARKYIAYRYISMTGLVVAVLCLAFGLLLPLFQTGSGPDVVFAQWSDLHDVMIFGIGLSAAVVASLYRKKARGFEKLIARRVANGIISRSEIEKLFVGLSDLDAGLEDMSGLPFVERETA